MSFPTQPKRKRADHRTRQTALKHESFAWAATLYPDDPEKVMELAGYKPSLAGHKKVLESPHVKKRMQDLKERVLCDGWRQAAEIVVEEPTKEAVITKLWEFATGAQSASCLPGDGAKRACQALRHQRGSRGRWGQRLRRRGPPCTASQAH